MAGWGKWYYNFLFDGHVRIAFLLSLFYFVAEFANYYERVIFLAIRSG